MTILAMFSFRFCKRLIETGFCLDAALFQRILREVITLILAGSSPVVCI
jgi:hypothetical protein